MTSKPRAKESRQKRERTQQRQRLIEAATLLYTEGVLPSDEYNQSIEEINDQFADLFFPER